MRNVGLNTGNLRFFGSLGITAQKDIVNILPGSYSGIFCIFSGVNDTGDDWEFSDGAGVKIKVGGETILDMGAGFLSDWSNLKGGATDNVSTTASTVQQACVAPFQTIIENAVVFEQGKANTIEWDYGGSLADLASGNIYFYGIESSAPNTYTPYFFEHTEAAYSGDRLFRLPVPNLLELWGVGATPANVDEIRLELDGDVVSDSTYLANHTWANFVNQVETGLTYFHISPITQGDLREGASQSTNIRVNNSSSTAVTYYVFAFNKAMNFDVSVQLRQEKINRRMAAIRSAVVETNTARAIEKSAIKTR